MKGLFVRDAIWLGKQRMLLVCMLALTVFYLFSDLHAFGVAFLPLMLAMLVCRTVQNDVSRACRRMFFTMPFNTRDYLIEKYCGAIIPPMLLSLVLMALGTLSPQMAWNQVPVALVMVLATVSVTVAVEIPIILAFRDRAAVMHRGDGRHLYDMRTRRFRHKQSGHPCRPDLHSGRPADADWRCCLLGVHGRIRVDIPSPTQQSRMVIVGDCGCDADTIMHTGA